MVHTLFVIGCKLRYHFERAEILEGQIACSKPQDLNNVGICCSFLQFVSVLCHPSKVNKSVSPPFLESKRERFNNCWWRAFESFTICGLELFSPKSERQGCQQLHRAWRARLRPCVLLGRQPATSSVAEEKPWICPWIQLWRGRQYRETPFLFLMWGWAPRRIYPTSLVPWATKCLA